MHVLGRHFGLGNYKNIASAAFVLSSFDLQKEVSLDLPPSTPIFNGWGGGGKSPTMSNSTLDHQYYMCQIVLRQLWVVKKLFEGGGVVSCGAPK